MNGLVQRLSDDGYVDETNIEIVSWGIERIRELLVDIWTAVISGLFTDELAAALIFEIVYISLRVYAGGYHASNERICRYLSWGSIVLSVMLIHYVKIPEIVQHFLVAMTVFIILIWAPSENPNKPLYEKEKKIFRRRSIVVALIESVLYLVLFKCEKDVWARAICVGMVLVGAGVKIRTKRKGSETIEQTN